MPRRQQRSVIGRRCCTLIVLNVIAGLVAGCVFHTQYPRDWPALAAKGTDHCPSMTGYFENFFSETTGPKDLPPLSVLLGIDRGGRVLAFVQNPDQKLVVRATDSSGSIIIEEKALDYTCDEDGIQLGGHYGIHDANVVGTISRDSLRLTRATDGSLVVRRQSTDFVLILGVIPGGFVSGADWYRFAPWKPRPFGSQDLSGSDPH